MRFDHRGGPKPFKAYLGGMVRSGHGPLRRRVDRMPIERVTPVRERRSRVRRVACQWRDGAGELHIAELSAAQSWPFLHGPARR